MATISLEDAQKQLPALIHRLLPGDEVLILENDRPVARLMSSADEHKSTEPRKLGTLQGAIPYMADDFDAPLEDFTEYSR